MGTHVLNSRRRRGLGEWHVDEVAPIPRLRGRTFSIVGCGRIGTAAALRAKAFGFKVAFYDPYLPDGVEKALGVRRVDHLEDLVSRSHVLSVHCPLTEETRGLIGAGEIAAMPSGGILINTARGGIVDTAAVIGGARVGPPGRVRNRCPRAGAAVRRLARPRRVARSGSPRSRSTPAQSPHRLLL